MKTKLLLLSIVLALALLPAGAFAALQVNAFSCNSQSGTITVDSTGTLNCQATIENTDASNSANLSSVSLFLDGGWAEQASYTGTGFDSSVNAGASTTATFGGINPTTSGTHDFLYVKLDTVTDSYPTSSSVNAVSIKSLTLTVPDETARNDDSTVNAEVTAGGDLSVSLELSVTSGACMFAEGESATKDLGSMTDNQAKATSWQVTQGADTCAFSVTATGTATPVTVTKTKTDSILTTSSDNTAPTAPTVDVVPDSPTAANDLTCNITINSTDEDGDTITFYYDWYKDDVIQTERNTSVVSSLFTAQNETWKCVATPNDGTVNGTSGEDQVRIGNNAPTAPTVSISPSGATAIDTLTCSVTTESTDADGDTVTYSYAWYKDNVLQTSLTSTTVSSSLTTAGEVWKCRVTPNDGHANGPAGEAEVTLGAGPSTDTTTSAGGGGGGGAGGAVLPQESATFGNMAAGATVKAAYAKSIDLYVTDISLTAKNELKNAIVKVLKYTTKPASVPSIAPYTYAYLNIEKYNFEDEDLEKALINFKVEKSWLTENGLDANTVTLSRYTGTEWEELPTTKKSEGAEWLYYTTETTAFSFFAITAEKEKPVEEAAPIVEEEVAAPVVKEEPEPEPREEAVQAVVTEKSNWPLISGIVLVLLLIIGWWALRMTEPEQVLKSTQRPVKRSAKPGTAKSGQKKQ